MTSALLKYLAPIITITLGALIFVGLMKTRPEVATAQAEAPVTVVDVMSVDARDIAVEIDGNGNVTAAQQVVLLPEVSGRLISIHENLVSGGVLKAGEIAAQIDPQDYRLALTQSNANVQRAKFEVELERGRRVIAEREWELLGKELTTTKEGRRLALRKPHARNAQANLASAISASNLAARNLSRTRLKVPFNAMVLTENADLGMLASPQTPVATLIGTDAYWVQVSMPYDQLTRLKVPGLNADATGGSSAKVSLSLGERDITFEGKLLRLLGDMDPQGRLAKVIVEVKDPLGLNSPEQGSRFPLLLGSFVKVKFAGESIPGAISIPRQALRDNNKVWVVGAENALEVRDVTIAWRTSDNIITTRGLKAGDNVITSRLDGVEGMALRINAASAATTTKGAQ